MFAYCLNNPINYVDPSGELVLIDDLVVVGIAALTALVVVLIVPPPPVIEIIPSTFTLPEIFITSPVRIEASISEAKTKGKENIRDTGLSDLSDAEISKRARDKSLPKSERGRYLREEKGRGYRNAQKRKAHFSTPTFK